MTTSLAVRPGTETDAIDGVLPNQVALPGTAGELAQQLAQASRNGQRTVLRGGGSKLGWGRAVDAVDLVIGTTRLNRLLAHRHGDLTATVEAGMPLAWLNQHLALHNQCLPVDSAFEGATVGGVLATNDCGPLRHRFGTPRDLLIGITLALTDGRVVKSGGTVVKNVAGYDLGKLMSGSHGTLAAIVDATFKLLPIPPASTTVVATYGDGHPLARDISALLASQVEIAACDIRMADGGRPQLLVRMASSPAATDAQAVDVVRLLSSSATRVSGDAEKALWDEQIRLPWTEAGAVIRFSWLPSKVAAVVGLVARLSSHGCRAAVFTGRSVGSGFVRLEGRDASVVAAIGELRESPDVGHVVVLRAARPLKAAIDVWGPPSSATEVARALKRKLDPAGILGAGRGPI